MPAVPLTITQIRDGLHSPYSLDETDQFTFSIPDGDSFWETSAGNYTGGNMQPFTDYSVLNATQADAFRAAIAAWDALIEPDFTEVADTAVSHGEVRAAFTCDQMGGSTAAYAFQGSNQTQTSIVGDVWINSTSTGDTFAIGTNDFSTLLHEMGHVLGLKHPFVPTTIPDPYETTRYSVMSYTDAARVVTFGGGGFSISSMSVAVATITPMVLDIAAVQDLYGADPDTNLGHTVYTFDQDDAFLQSIYDAGGQDTLDLSAISRPNIVDLEPGASSSIGVFTAEDQAEYWKQFYTPGLHDFIDTALAGDDTYEWTDNLGIAFTPTIENVLGGTGDDTITGNAVANNLDGRGGDDIIDGAGGSDVLNGRVGDDVLTGGFGHDDLFGGGGNDDLHGDGGNDRVYGNAGNDTVNGDLGEDSVFGGGGNDTVYGGNGDDILNGHAGDDLIVGGPGNDLLTGGLGADRFLINPGHLGGGLAATDRIRDFSHAQGDVIDLHNLDARSTHAGNQAFSWIGNAAFSGAAGELRYAIAGNTTTVYGDTNGDGTADFALWLTGQINLVAGVFVL
jgi:Ca2+-binding RTX toxin-like protein